MRTAADRYIPAGRVALHAQNRLLLALTTPDLQEAAKQAAGERGQPVLTRTGISTGT
jgi:hypothetical protein